MSATSFVSEPVTMTPFAPFAETWALPVAATVAPFWIVTPFPAEIPRFAEEPGATVPTASSVNSPALTTTPAAVPVPIVTLSPMTVSVTPFLPVIFAATSTSPFSALMATFPSVAVIALSTDTAVVPGSPVTVMETSFALMPETTSPPPTATASVPSLAVPPAGSDSTSVTVAPVPASVPTVTALSLLFTTTLFAVSIATTEASVNVVTPSLLVIEPFATTVSVLSFLYVVPPPVDPMDTPLSVTIFAAATYTTSPPTAPFALTLMSPPVAWTYLSAVALTTAFSVIPFAAASVTLLPETAAVTSKVALVDSRRMLPSEASTSPATVNTSFVTIRMSSLADTPSTLSACTAAGLLGS